MVFLYILLVILIIIMLLIFSKIKIEIKNLKFMSQNKEKVNNDFRIIIKLYILGKIPIFKLSITKDKLKRMKVKEKVINVEKDIIENKGEFEINTLKNLKKLKLNIKEIELKSELGIEDAMITSIIVPAISTALAILIQRKMKDYRDFKFEIKPLYINQNIINIIFSGIFELKMIHIINIIYVTKKKGRVIKNERTSNRRSYDYGYEQY